MAQANPRRANGTRRDKLRRRVLREEDICHLCGQAVDKTLPHGLPASPEVDEIIPVVYGGDPFDRANCALAHRRPPLLQPTALAWADRTSASQARCQSAAVRRERNPARHKRKAGHVPRLVMEDKQVPR